MSLPEPRIPVNLDLRVWGMAADGRVFSQHARARNVSSRGALLSDIERDVKIGDTIGVQQGGKKVRCKVIWAQNTRSDEKIRVGVQILKNQECPWTAVLPKKKEPSIGPRNQRRFHRHKISFVLALYDEYSPIPQRVTATDISASGCYVETLSPYSVGASLTVELCFSTETIRTRAFVRTSYPGVGIGIEFMGLKPEEQERFQKYLRAMNPWACSIEHQNTAAKN